MKKVCHLTSVHPRFDVRIFHKECTSLKNNNYDVSLVVADNLGDELVNEIQIFDVGKEISRIKRMFFTSKNVFKKAIEIDADIYHFHDPELLPFGKKLLKLGKKVIYDVHEDLPRQLLTKPYLNKVVRKIISIIFEKYEDSSSKKISAIVTATDFIKERFSNANPNVVSLKNYPILNDISENIWSNRQNIVAYVGLLSRERGIKELVQATDFFDAKLHIAGKFINSDFEKKITNLPQWKNVSYYGFVGRDKIAEILKSAKIGAVTLYPTINYKDALPVKMFEYMLAGIPVLASNIELWQSILSENKCGLTVNPKNPKKIADMINQILIADNSAKEMGENGRKSILEKYNWANEENILLKTYSQITD